MTIKSEKKQKQLTGRKLARKMCYKLVLYSIVHRSLVEKKQIT